MNDADWSIISARLMVVWPAAKWPETTLAVWRAELENGHLDGESVYNSIRELAIASGRIPALSDLYKAAQSIRYKRRLAERAARSAAEGPETDLPEGVLAVLYSDNYQPLAILSPHESEEFEKRGGPRLGIIPFDIHVTHIVGSRRAVDPALWPQK